MDGDDATRARRAEWLAQLAEALVQAQRLTSRLIEWRVDSQEAILLRIQIQAVRAQVEALRRSDLPALSATEVDQLLRLFIPRSSSPVTSSDSLA